MDANSTRYHLILGDDWRDLLDEQAGLAAADLAAPPHLDEGGLAWGGPRAELTLRARILRFVAGRAEAPLRPEQRRGAGRDRYGSWYWVGDDGRSVMVRSAGSGRTSRLWPPPPPAPAGPGAGFAPVEPPPRPPDPPLAGLAVTREHYLAVGVRGDPQSGPPGLLLFDLHAGGPPRRLRWPAAVPFAPFDMAPSPRGGLWVLDRANKRFWGLDRQLAVLGRERDTPGEAPAPPEAFEPLAGGPRRRPPPADMAAAATPLPLADPIAIEVLPDDSVLVLDYEPAARFARVYRYRRGRLLDVASTEGLADLVDAGGATELRLVGYDFALQPAARPHEPGTLTIVAADGNQAFAFHLTRTAGRLSLAPEPAYLPLRLFGGRALVAAGERVYYDSGGAWAPLVAQRRPRYEPGALLRSRPLDGREPACVWHRVLLDACLPAEAAVEVWSRAADDLAALQAAPWEPEPRPYRRGDGSELPFQPPPGGEREGTYELLLQRARGRYLQLLLRLSGSGRATPRLRALRAYYPRFSYSERYLPGVYRADPLSASFLERFLANLEGIATTVEDRIAAAQLLLDVRSAPPDALPWLAGWLGAALDQSWDDRRRRLFIRHALDFYQWAGTARGLQMALRLALDPCAGEEIFGEAGGRLSPYRIVERFRSRLTPAALLGDPGGAAGPGPTGLERLRAERAALLALWQGFLSRRHPTLADLQSSHGASYASFGAVGLPAAQPPPGPLADDWADFCQGTPLERSARGWRLWQEFLARRYDRVAALNLAHGGGWPAFGSVPLPPEGAAGAQAADWAQFAGVVLAMHGPAHAFTVLLPATGDERRDEAALRSRLELVRRLVELEKPAHTVFDIRFYWAMFRVGEARLGYDSLVDRGSRAPELLAPLVLDEQYIGESYPAAGHPQSVAERLVVGRDGPGSCAAV